MTVKTLTPVAASLAGAVLTTAAMGGTDTAFEFVNDGGTIVVVENGSAGVVTASPTAGSIDGLTITSPVISVTNGTSKFFGPFDPKYFNVSGKCTIVINSPATTISALAIKLS